MISLDRRSMRSVIRIISLVPLWGMLRKIERMSGSEMMLDHLVAHNNIGRPQSDYDFIKALIAGEHERVCVVACR